MTIYSDTEPKGLLDTLLRKYKVIRTPTNYGWTASNVGSGTLSQYPSYLDVRTGTTANSRGLGWTAVQPLNSGNMSTWLVDFSKYLELHFYAVRFNSDPEAVARFQLKTVITEGALSACGIGIEADNYSILGEAYGTARGTVNLGTFTDAMIRRFKIVLYPASRVEFWVDDALAGALTGNYVPTGSGSSYLVASIINGLTGGVNAALILYNITTIQEW